MTAVGMSQIDADHLLDNLLLSDMRGVRSHGLTRLAAYIYRIEKGLTDAKSQPEIIQDYPAAITIDGKNAMGSTIATFTMSACIERAKKAGTCFATVNHANHYGFGAYYTDLAAKENMIGFAVCNTPALVAPFGGAAAALGTNPVSCSVPANRHPAFVMDMATSVVARGKIDLAYKTGQSIPDHWAIDANGYPTTDPAKARLGTLLPFGGPKGYAIGLLIDILCGPLAGAKTSRHIESVFESPTQASNIGYFMGAIDISKFTDVQRFKDDVDRLFDEIKALPSAPGFDCICIPGEMEYHATETAKHTGIDLPDAVIQELTLVGQRYHVPFPSPHQAES